jgi:pilus assembly protein Flp/PilA
MLDRINTFFAATHNRLQREEGQAIAEYALILALIAVVAAGVLLTMGGAISDKLGDIQSAITGG